MPGASRNAYLALAILFGLVLMGQTLFTIDVVRDVTGDYVWRTISIGAPWPSIASADPPAARAGLKSGDPVAAIDNLPLSGEADFLRIIRSKHPGDTLRVTIDRNGDASSHEVLLGPIMSRPPLFWLVFVGITWLLLPWLSILLGFWTAFMRPRDKRAWFVLGMLLGLAMLNRPQVLDPRGWPAPIGLTSFAVRDLSESVWAICMLLFGFYFPQRWRFDRHSPWVKWVISAPIAITAVWDCGLSVLRSVNWQAAASLPGVPLPAPVRMALIMISISFFFVALSDKRADEALACDDRRRLKLIYWGCSIALTPMFALFLFDLIVRHRLPGDADGLVLALALMSMILFPITLAYVIVVHRALDVRMVIRQGLQYALAHRGVRVIQVLLTIGVVATAASALDTSISRPQKMMVIALGVIVVVRVRDLADRVRRLIDRKFFREAYNAEQILGELSEEVRTILEKETLLQTVARRISESLHVDRIAVMLQDGGLYRPALAAGYSAPLDIVMPSEAPSVEQMRRSREPVTVDDRIPEVERKTLRRLDAQLLLPLASHKELLGFISLGPKRSEEPYSRSDTLLLRSVAAQTGLALENSRLSEAIAHEVAQRELLNREIEIAREVQERLFPQNKPEVAALEYAGHCRPARGVGGDYYDFLALASGRLGLAIGDVSGKGVPAALLMASLQASVRGQSQAVDSDVAGLMTTVNRLVCDATPENRYATFFYGQFDPATRKLVYTNGGHNAPMLLRGSEIIRLEVGGPPVGLFRFSRYEQGEAQLEPGDLLVLYTDGVSEAENPAEEEWGEDALAATARACVALPPNDTIQRIMKAADEFAAGAPQHDDMTLVIARVCG
jgi:sigma-B regulation protein RsbU (phosphoserine phosphatase)